MSQHFYKHVYCKNQYVKVSYSTVQYVPEIPSPATIDELSEYTVSSATIDELSEYTVSSTTIDDPSDYTRHHRLQLTNLPIVTNYDLSLQNYHMVF